MTKETAKKEFPPVSAEDVSDSMERKQVIYLRVSEAEKKAVKRAAAFVHLSSTDYLIRCHELVSSKLTGLDGHRKNSETADS
tara:strand:- start:696 stop:941 length:246 start_codon:yes stop_codon:yes gene_type:complete